MSDIGGIQGSGSPEQIRSVGGQPYAQSPPPVSPAEQGDTVEISLTAEMLGKMHALPDIRIEKVAPVRQAIEAGTYDTEEKLDVAIERLLEDLD